MPGSTTPLSGEPCKTLGKKSVSGPESPAPRTPRYNSKSSQFSVGWTWKPPLGHASRRVYTSAVGLLIPRLEPQAAGTGRDLSLIHVRPASARPIPAWAAGKGDGCIALRLRGKLHPRGGSPWISFLYVFFL